MKRKNNYVVCYLAVIAMNVFVLNGCNDDDPEPLQNPKYDLILEVNHQDGGNVIGAGSYEASEHISIAASCEEGWVFVNWIGDTLYIDDPFSANTTVTMPAQDVSITAIFLIGSIVDIDGNVYQSIIIGDQEWMTENLRVSKYNNGDAITTNISDEDWYYTTEGAYTIYPHDGGSFDDTEGINSDKEMTTAYGKLYNWYAVDDARKVCPKGWKVPNNDDWKKLFNYVISEGFPNEIAHPTGAGHALKSCRQVDSPLGGDCNSNEHPRWNKPYGNRYGFDEFGFSALPAGLFFVEVDDICGGYKGRYFYLGRLGFWWSSSDYSSTNAWHLKMHQDYGLLDYGVTGKKGGFSIRCIRDVED